MRRLERAIGLALFPLFSCARSSAPPATEPAPVTAEPSAAPTQPVASQWSFAPAYRTMSYRSSTVSTVRTKTPPERSESAEITSAFTINVDQRRNPFLVSGEVMNLSSNRSAVRLSLPLSFTGAGDSVRLTSEPSPADTVCNPAADVALGEIRTVLGNWPLHLANNSVWTDSLTSKTCASGGIPLVAKRSRSYRVTGATNFNGVSAIVVARTETIEVEGEGASGQHQVHIQGAGKGTSTIYVDAQAGLPVAVDAQEELNITLLSGRRQEFIQTLRQKVQRN